MTRYAGIIAPMAQYIPLIFIHVCQAGGGVALVGLGSLVNLIDTAGHPLVVIISVAPSAGAYIISSAHSIIHRHQKTQPQGLGFLVASLRTGRIVVAFRLR